MTSPQFDTLLATLDLLKSGSETLRQIMAEAMKVADGCAKLAEQLYSLLDAARK